MRIRYLVICVAVVLSTTQARAAEGFVIESSGASIAVGTAVDDATTVSIAAGGHLVLLTSTGQMFRRNGPFQGAALGAAAGIAGAPLKSGTLDALVDLAVEKGTAQNRIFATRAVGRGGAAGPFSIAPETKTYCHRADIAPEFVLSQPPGQDLPLILDRISNPKSSRTGYWPAGLPNFAWPPDWPPPAAGNYEWSTGYAQGAFAVKVVRGTADPGNLFAVAAELKRLGCGEQARATLHQAIEQATLLD